MLMQKNPFLFLSVSTHLMRDFTGIAVSFIMNVSTHLMRDLIPHQVGGDALIRWSPSCGGWGPNSIESLTNTCIYNSDNKQHYYLSILMHNNGSMQA